MKLALFQIDVKYGDIKANSSLIKKQLLSFQYDVAILPELCTSGSILLSKEHLQSFANSSDNLNFVDDLKKISSMKNSAIIFGFIEKAAHKYFNSAGIIKSDGTFLTQRKINLPDFEKHLYSKGQRLKAFDFYGVKMGVLVCYDVWFDESFETLISQGAKIIINIANFCGEDSIEKIVNQAKKFNVFIVVTNRVGMDHFNEHGIKYIGHSFIVDPLGNIVSQLGTQANVLTFDFDCVKRKIA